MEIELKLNPFVKKSQRITTSILDLLGDLGGFYATVDLFLFLLGGYFSNRFYQAAIAKDFYFKKAEKKRKSNQRLKAKFKKGFSEEPLNILGK